jgi:hypothetical protein
MTVHHSPPGIDLRPSGYSSSAIGARSELVACAELMRLGFHVYRCESPTAPFDLVAYRDGRCLRVEVKSVTLKNQHPQFSWPKNAEWDLLVVVGDQADVFLFEPSMARLDIVNAVRVHYGSPTIEDPVRPACGTNAGYARHRRLKEAPCHPCAEAMRKYYWEYRRAKAVETAVPA